MNKRLVYIHIGTMKTGSTALQTFFKTNSNHLKKRNIYYPNIISQAGNFLGFSLLPQTPPLVHQKMDINSDELYSRLNREIENSIQDRILLSCEAYYLLSTDMFFGRKFPFLLKDMLLKNENKYQFKIIIYLRQQDDYAESLYKQFIKTHNFYNYYSKTIHEFIEEFECLLNFKDILSYWEEAFGKENLIVKIYDKSKFHQKNIFSDFLEIFQIKVDDNFKIPPKDINASLGIKSTEFFRIANSHNPLKNPHQLNKEFVNIVTSLLDKDDKGRTSPLLSHNEKQKLLKKYKQDNEVIKNTYFEDAGNGPLFPVQQKKVKDPSETLTEECLKVEDAVKVAVEIWNSLQRELLKTNAKMPQMKNDTKSTYSLINFILNTIRKIRI
jgi:hypothetical protein